LSSRAWNAAGNGANAVFVGVGVPARRPNDKQHDTNHVRERIELAQLEGNSLLRLLK